MGINIAVTITDDSAVLTALVGDPKKFAARYWGQAPLYRAADEAWAAELLTVDDIETLLLTGARVPTFRLVRDGRRLPQEEVCRPLRLAGRQLDDVADPERIGAAVADGATLVAQGLERTSLRVGELCRSLERAPWITMPKRECTRRQTG